jgi:hypothetical protein
MYREALAAADRTLAIQPDSREAKMIKDGLSRIDRSSN